MQRTQRVKVIAASNFDLDSRLLRVLQEVDLGRVIGLQLPHVLYQIHLFRLGKVLEVVQERPELRDREFVKVVEIVTPAWT